MIDTDTLMEQCQKDARAETIAKERVISLRPDLSAAERGNMALDGIEAALGTLQMVADHLAPGAYERLRDIEVIVNMLCPRVKLARSLIHLTDAFGKAPT